MKKADYMKLGRADAAAGTMANQPSVPGTWQYKAYNEGRADVFDAVKPKASPLVEEFRRAALMGANRVLREGTRRAEAMVKRIKHRQALRKMRARPAPKTWFIPSSPNIKRGSAWSD